MRSTANIEDTVTVSLLSVLLIQLILVFIAGLVHTSTIKYSIIEALPVIAAESTIPIITPENILRIQENILDTSILLISRYAAIILFLYFVYKFFRYKEYSIKILGLFVLASGARMLYFYITRFTIYREEYYIASFPNSIALPGIIIPLIFTIAYPLVKYKLHLIDYKVFYKHTITMITIIVASSIIYQFFDTIGAMVSIITVYVTILVYYKLLKIEMFRLKPVSPEIIIILS